MHYIEVQAVVMDSGSGRKLVEVFIDTDSESESYTSSEGGGGSRRVPSDEQGMEELTGEVSEEEEGQEDQEEEVGREDQEEEAQEERQDASDRPPPIISPALSPREGIPHICSNSVFKKWGQKI